jgi:1,4-dihydroxy-2-naphthoate octaprenyltransferase
MALMVWALVQALMLSLRSDLARIEDDRAAGRRTIAARLGRGRTVRLLRIVNVEALAFALTAVATGVFSPSLALLAGGVALMTARAVRAQG